MAPPLSLVVVPAFFDPAMCLALVDVVADIDLPRQAGRQGTGYDKVDLLSVDAPVVVGARDRLTALLAQPPAFDAWWLEYPVTSHIPAHTDPSPADGLAHLRVNVVVARAGAAPGGVFMADGAVVPLAVGDAVIFRPDVVSHAVTPVSGAPRRVLSVGTVMAPADAAAVLARVFAALRR